MPAPKGEGSEVVLIMFWVGTSIKAWMDKFISVGIVRAPNGEGSELVLIMFCVGTSIKAYSQARVGVGVGVGVELGEGKFNQNLPRYNSSFTCIL